MKCYYAHFCIHGTLAQLLLQLRGFTFEHKGFSVANHLERWGFVVIVLAVLGFGAWLHAVNLPYALPYIEEFDEARLFWNAYAQRIGKPEMMDLFGYPPAIYMLSMGIQAWVEAYTQRPAEFDMTQVTFLMRVLAWMCNLLTASVLAWCVAWFSGRWWGALAAAGWLWASALVPHTVAALTESYQTLLSVCAAALALHAVRTTRPLPALASVALGLLGVIFKYSFFPVLGFGVGASLWLLPRNPRRWLLVLVAQSALIAAVAWVLFVLYEASNNPNPEYQRVLDNGITLNISVSSVILPVAFGQLNVDSVLGMTVCALGVLAWGMHKPRGHALLCAAWGGITLFALWMITQYLVYERGLPRYTTPFSALLAGVFVLGLAGMARLSRRAQPMVTLALFGLAIVVWLLPQAQAAVAFVELRARPHTSGEMARWAADVVQMPTTVLVNHTINYSWEGQRIFSRDRGGWIGDHWLSWVTEDFDSRPALDWASDGVGFFLDDTPDVRADPDLLLLRTFPPPNSTQAWQGPAVLRLYRLGGISRVLDVAFGGFIRLIGYDLSSERVRAGDTLTITPYWQAIAPPNARYHVFFHLVSMTDETPLAQADGTPSSYRNRPTETWRATDEVHIGQSFTLVLPAELPEDTYRLLVGLYALEDGVRLPLADGRTVYSLAQIAVTR